MQNFLNRYFSVIMTISAAIGLLIPSIKGNTEKMVLFNLGLIIFCSLFKVELSKDVLMENTKKALIYFAIRYCVLPIIIFFIIKPFSQFYSIGFLLMCMLPAAVASPAFSNIYKGNVNLSMAILLVSSFAAILVIPFFCSWFIHDSMPINRSSMLKTLLYIIIIPLTLHLPFRRFNGFRNFMIQQNTLITVLSLSTMLIIIFSKYKNDVLNNLFQLVEYTTISFIGYFLLYIIGWFLLVKFADEADKKTYSISSGANNIGLGVVITLLYFPAGLSLFFIIANIAWVTVMIPMKWWFRKMA